MGAKNPANRPMAMTGDSPLPGATDQSQPQAHDHHLSTQLSPYHHPRLSRALLRRPWLTALLAGALCALAMPPVGFFPILWLGFPVLLFLVRHGPGGWSAFWRGWLFGFGFFTIGLYWISFALAVDIARLFWLLPLTIAGLPALLAVFFGAVTIAWRRIGLAGIPGVLVFGLLWGAGEWLRGHLFTGFPWHLMAYAWDQVLPVGQLAWLLGAYGLSILTIAAAAMPATLLARQVPKRRALLACLLMAALLAGGGLWGHMRLARYPADGESLYPGVLLRLVQPGIDQREKWKTENWPAHFNLQLQLSGADADGVTHVIWPETAATFFLDRDSVARNLIAEIVPNGGAAIIGAPRVEQAPGSPARYYNSAQIIEEDGSILDSYDKSHLVPFGEYVPLSRWFPFVQAAAGTTDYSAGSGLRTLFAPGLPAFSPLVCYEVIFPGQVVGPPAQAEDSSLHEPRWLLNITNDAWYGLTAGPHQHFAIARMRAIEEGLPLVRVATNGISGLIDPLGRILGRIPLGSMGVLDVPLPKPLVVRENNEW